VDGVTTFAWFVPSYLCDIGDGPDSRHRTFVEDRQRDGGVRYSGWTAACWCSRRSCGSLYLGLALPSFLPLTLFFLFRVYSSAWHCGRFDHSAADAFWRGKWTFYRMASIWADTKQRLSALPYAGSRRSSPLPSRWHCDLLPSRVLWRLPWFTAYSYSTDDEACGLCAMPTYEATLPCWYSASRLILPATVTAWWRSRSNCALY